MTSYVSVWVATFKNEIELENYISLEYQLDNELPFSDFTEDFNIDYYDEDFQDAYFSKDLLPAKDLITPISYSDKFINLIRSEQDTYNSVIALYDFSYSGKIKNCHNVKLLGIYEYEK